MEYTVDTKKISEERLYKIAFILAVFTIVYNIVEGFIATFFGYEDESLTLFGFGTDSFIEVISGIGIAVMIKRIWANPHSSRTSFEKSALKITGTAFYLLVVTLSITTAYNLYVGHAPTSTFWGIVISSISIAVMWGTILWKVKIGKALHSDAILADAECARVCIYMSIILLLSSGIYALTGFPYTDSIGAIGLIYFSYKEGKECFEKASSEKYCGCEH